MSKWLNFRPILPKMDVSATTSKEQENEPEKPSTNLPCGVPKCQAIRICICKLSDRHNEQVDKHISTPEGKKFPHEIELCQQSIKD